VELHPALDRGPIEAVFDKGEHAAAYSGFEGAADGVALADWLRQHEVDSVDVVGIATDHCVRATALDAVAIGLSTRVLLHLTAGVSEATTEAALDQLRTAGIELEGTVHRPS
jgi:nicotinamidase/pyrazinamidase